MPLSPLPGFQSLDEQGTYKTCIEKLEQINTSNFAIEFDNANAYVRLDLDRPEMEQMLDPPRSKGPLQVTRWIHIFGPERQPTIIAAIARKYELSPRLQGIICSKPLTPQRADPGPSRGRNSAVHPRSPLHNGMAHQAAKSNPPDPEKDSPDSDNVLQSFGMDISHYRIVDEVWHFCSTDWTPKCLCVGYNSLTDLSVKPPEEGGNLRRQSKDGKRMDLKEHNKSGDPSSQGYKSKPEGKRVWMWLMLCGDGTVISIQENALPGCKDPLGDQDQHTLRLVRRNLINVFNNLSKLNEQRRKDHPLQILDIRPGFQLSQGTTVQMEEAAGLLFYYIFDDWHTTYALVAREEQQYAHVLQEIVGTSHPTFFCLTR